MVVPVGSGGGEAVALGGAGVPAFVGRALELGIDGLARSIGQAAAGEECDGDLQ